MTEAKTFVLKNKKAIKEAQIMEGPLGSGGWTPKKAYNNFKKGYERFNNLQKMDKTKDSFGQNIFNYLTAIVGNVGKDMEMTNTFGIGRDKKVIIYLPMIMLIVSLKMMNMKIKKEWLVHIQKNIKIKYICQN